MPRISFAKPTNNGWSPLPEGTYDVQITDIETGRVSKNGNQQIIVKGEVAQGEYATKGTSAFYTFTEAANFRIVALLEAAGVQYSEGPDGLEFETDDLIGTFVRIVITVREYDGKQQNDWKKVLPSSLGQPAQVQPTQSLPAARPAVAPAAAPVATTQAVVAAQQVQQAAAPVAARRARA